MLARAAKLDGRRGPPAQPVPLADDRAMAAALVLSGAVPAHLALQALARRGGLRGALTESLIAQGSTDAATLVAALGRELDLPVIDPLRLPPDPGLLARFGAAQALAAGVLPWRAAGGRTVVLTSRPADLDRCRDRLQALFGPVDCALAPPGAIEAAVLAAAGPALSQAAETTVRAEDSARSSAAERGPAQQLLDRRLALGAAAGFVALALWTAPAAAALLLTLAALLATTVNTTLRAAAALAAERRPGPGAEPAALPDSALPLVSMLVALYREADIAPRLVRRLERLDYPRDRLEVILAVEADDTLTRAALARRPLPLWMRVALVPPGRLRTKPRALNHALAQSSGSLIGVYDAEDAPAPDQLRRVAATFAAAPADVGCVQGVLDFYNPRANWIARMFTLEYATWFRLVLPGLARLRLPVPLGGTTLFFRRDALQDVGAWDAWNVTEDADLGIRLARHGWRTALFDSVTLEEANCRAWPWVRQRSRWIKGYMMTWAVHMRRPRDLWRELGPRAFLGFQALFLGALVQALLAPFLWSFWAIPLGLPHPARDWPGAALAAVVGLFLACEAVNLATGWRALRRRGGGVSPLWLLAHHVYFPLATLAAIKAGWEMAFRPYYWDKTAHGLTAAAGRRQEADGLQDPRIAEADRGDPALHGALLRGPARPSPFRLAGRGAVPALLGRPGGAGFPAPAPRPALFRPRRTAAAPAIAAE